MHLHFKGPHRKAESAPGTPFAFEKVPDGYGSTPRFVHSDPIFFSHIRNLPETVDIGFVVLFGL